MSLAAEVQSWIREAADLDCQIEEHSSGHHMLMTPNHGVVCRELENPNSTTLAENEVLLWRDQWETRRETIKGRLLSLLGMSTRIHGRETEIVQLTQPEASDFVDRNHLLPPVKSKYKLGLTYSGELVTVACFGKECPIDRDGQRLNSIEMTRFCHANGSTVVGGLSKLIRQLQTQTSANDLMTQVDNSWFTSGSFEKVGFETYRHNSPVSFWVHPTTYRRMYAAQVSDSTLLADEGYREFQTQGSTKMTMPI